MGNFEAAARASLDCYFNLLEDEKTPQVAKVEYITSINRILATYEAQNIFANIRGEYRARLNEYEKTQRRI